MKWQCLLPMILCIVALNAVPGNSMPSKGVTELSDKDENPCDGKIDGNYPIPDVFEFLKCKNGKASYGSCKTGTFFVPNAGKCKKQSVSTLEDFCFGRGNSNWRNPWNCHSYIACSSYSVYVMPCPEKDTLVYNPYKDACVDEKEFACSVVNDVNPCKGHADGKYPIADVFRYLRCKNQIATLVDCPEQNIYDPHIKECADASNYDVPTFCQYRNNNDWRNPWDCHQFITCSNYISYNMNCTSGLVFDPYNDICEHAEQFQCKQVEQRAEVNDMAWMSVVLSDEQF